MRIIALDQKRLADFLAYCRQHRYEHDVSWLSEDDLNSFQVDQKNPTYLLLDQKSQIVGVVSLMNTAGYLANRKSRFRIFHSITPSLANYKLLLDAILLHTLELDDIYLFLPEERAESREIFEKLGFVIERYSWVMVRSKETVLSPAFPDGFELRPLCLNKDEQVWCDILNICFANIAGHIDSKPERIKNDLASEYYLDGGMLILWDGNKPVGLVRVSKDEEFLEDAYLDHLAVLPEYQKKGIGRNLLRAGVNFSKDKGYKRCWLSVNAENSNAANLYLSEGFDKEMVAICYNKKLKR